MVSLKLLSRLTHSSISFNKICPTSLPILYRHAPAQKIVIQLSARAVTYPISDVHWIAQHKLKPRVFGYIMCSVHNNSMKRNVVKKLKLSSISRRDYLDTWLLLLSKYYLVSQIISKGNYILRGYTKSLKRCKVIVFSRFKVCVRYLYISMGLLLRYSFTYLTLPMLV